MSDIDGLEVAEGGVEQLLKMVTTALGDLDDTGKQLEIISTAVHNFVMQTMQQVDGNEDTAAVNQVLANALLQVKDFIIDRKATVKISKQQLEAKLDAFEQVKLVMNEARSVSEQSKTKKVEPPPPPEQHSEKKRELLEQFDEDGKHIKRIRKIGERPESLKTIRGIEAELASRKNLEEDI